MIQLKIEALELVEGSPLVRVHLQDEKGEKELEIWVGLPEASAIQAHLEGITPPRPMTHDLMCNIMSTLEAKVIRLVISDMKNDTFYALLTMALGEEVYEVDCRPSDGMALALRFEAPILISEALLSRINKMQEERGEASPPGSIIVRRDDTTIH